jgi:hypothetical protein
MGKLLVLVGLCLAGLGLLIMAGLPLGRLPGDIYLKRENFTVYLPITTSILLSIVLTVILSLFRR